MKFRGILALLGLLVVAGTLVAYVAADRAEGRRQAPQGQASPRSGEATEPDCGAETAHDGSSSETPPQQGAKSEAERASNEAKPAGPSADDPLGGIAPCEPDP